MRTTSNKGIELIKEFEGFVGHAYKAVPSEPYYTIGFGHYGKSVKPTDTITKSLAEILLKDDLKVYEAKVNACDNIYHWTQSEFDALVSFCYNVGSINQLTQNGKRTKKQIAEAMLLYVKDCSGRPLEGLKRRRAKERELFLSPDSPTNPQVEYTEETTLKQVVDDIIEDKFGVEPDRVENVYKHIRKLVNKRFS